MESSLDTLRDTIKKLWVIRGLGSKQIRGKVYLVGGAIREISLSSIPKDYDFVLTDEQDLWVFEELFNARLFMLGKKPIQTYRLVNDNITVDITILKTTLEDDLFRRDFSMNSIAYDIKEDKLEDPLNGFEDIRKRLIRHIRKDNLIDDPLRMLKAVRHFATIEGFSIHKELLDSIKDLKRLINKVAPERIKYEFDQIVTSKISFEALKVLERAGLLFEILPELYTLKQMDEEKRLDLEAYGHTIEGFRYLRDFGEYYYIDEKGMQGVAYALLFHDLGKACTFSYDANKDAVHFFYHERFSDEMASAIMERLRFSYNEIKTIKSLIKNHMRVFLISRDEATEKAVRRLVYKMGNLTPLLVLLTLCDMYGSSKGQDNDSTERIKDKCKEILIAYDEWQREPLPKLVTGHDLISIGFNEGPAIGRCLQDIQEKQLSGEIREKEDAMNYARERLHSLKKDLS